MKLHFDPNQSFQLEAIDAVSDLFDGQPRIAADLRFLGGAGVGAAVPNRLDLTDQDLLTNLHAVQDRGGIRRDPGLRAIEEPLDPADGHGRTARFLNFSVEMETGTGKTYVYLRTALELHRRYGWTKYIVVVPSVAVREGVLKTLEITRDHLRALYDNVPYRFYPYDSGNLARVRQFALSTGVEIMVMTLAAFNKDANVIRQTTDRLMGERPLRLVQAARPILILDEPQEMESDKSVAALASLHPLMALRYSATHRKPYNLVYRLTPYDAYRQGLVKRIEVAGVSRDDPHLQPYVRLLGIRTRKSTVTARLVVHRMTSAGAVREGTLTIRRGDDLQQRTGRSQYAGYVVEEINPAGAYLRFANGRELGVGEEVGADRDALFRAQIEYTVTEHLRKQERLRAHGLKVLSLFFLDRVDSYQGEDPIARRLFDRAFDAAKAAYPTWRNLSPDDVRAAYFAQRRTRTGDVVLEDSRTGEAERDREAYDLIMRDKERLLSLEEPRAFIFSHSALSKGWDNPNVFQICTLRQTLSEVQRRQEVGRGVRIAVNQEGQRVFDERLNVLTVVAPESYESFVQGLQDEVALEYRLAIEDRYGKPLDDLTDEERRAVVDEYGAEILPPRPANARRRAAAHLRKAYTLRPEFQALWSRIQHKTRYHVHIDSDRLVRDVTTALADLDVRPPRVAVTKAQVAVGTEDAFAALQISGSATLVDLTGRYPLPNLLGVMADLMERTTPPVRLTRATLLRILREAPPSARESMVANPIDFAAETVRIIKERLGEQLVRGIRYERIAEAYEMSLFEGEWQTWEEYLVPSVRPDGSDGPGLYDHTHVESDVERAFVEGLEARLDVRLYVKLPAWFTVETPIGEYNPDWAIVMDRPPDYHGPGEGPLIYLVRETKGTPRLGELRPDERRKILYGERHFRDALGTDFRLVTSATDLP